MYEDWVIKPHLPDNLENIIKIESGNHSEEYMKKLIELYKYLYLKLAISDILHIYSYKSKSSKLPKDVENEVKRIRNGAKRLLTELHDIDKYHYEGNHWQENKLRLHLFEAYLSSLYDVPIP